MNRSGGQNPQAGLSAQNWAALSLFIQQSFSPSFLRIELEKPKLADFVLVFDAKRIVCESKSKHVSYSDVRNILDSVTLGPEDELLVICKSITDGLEEHLENAKYFPPATDWLTEKKKFTPRHINLLSKLNFWIVDQHVNEEIARNLLEQRFNLWLPDNNLVNELLVEKIFKQSAAGGQYTRQEFVTDVEEYRQTISDNDDVRTKTKPADIRVKEIIDAITDPASRLASSSNPLQVLVSSPQFHSAAIDQLKQLSNLNVTKFGLFWDATYSSLWSREVFSIIKSHITDRSAAQYAVDFINKHAKTLRYKFNDEFQYKEAADLLEAVHAFTQDYDEDIVGFLAEFYKDAKHDVFYIKKQHGSKDWILGEIADAIERLYISTRSNSARDAILKFINNDFSLVQDDSQYWHETPPAIFSILHSFVKEVPLERLPVVIKKIISDYDAFHRRFTDKKPAFTGWDLMGGGTNNFGGDYHVDDKSFIRKIILPVLSSISRSTAMRFIWSSIETDAAQVSQQKPDFMNRVAIPFLVTEYALGEEQQRAKDTLTAFIKMRRGVPSKSELIYQAVRDADLSPEQKWNLLSIGLAEYHQPVNIFMDQILWQLLEVGDPNALETFSGLLGLESYMGRQFRWESTIPEAISRVIRNKTTLDRGMALLETYIHSEAFKDRLDVFDAYSLNTTLLGLIEIDPDKGFSVLQQLIGDSATRNQQAAFGSTLRDMPEHLQERAYDSIVDPLLIDTENAKRLAMKITSSETRESIIWFGEKLAKGHRYDAALRIAEFFAGDPDPTKNNELEKRVVKGEVNQQIASVRGSLPWILMQFCSVGGRDYIPKIFTLTKQLCFDESLYVRSQACMVLEALANARDTHMPDAPDNWFMSFAIARAIEALAFEMLRDETNHKPAVMKLLARVFVRMDNTMDEQQGVELINALLQFGDDEVLEGLAIILIFMAEFREAVDEHWPASRGILPQYDSSTIREILEKQAESGKDELRRHIAFELAKLPQNGGSSQQDLFGISMKYLRLLQKRYDHLVFESIYRFIEHYIDSNYEACYALWRGCLQVERTAIRKMYEKNKDGRATYSWWPYFYNGVVLAKTAARDFPIFLADFEYLVDYPENVIIASDIEKALNVLSEAKTNKEEVEALFKKLVERNPKFFEFYQKWQQSYGS